MYGSVDTHLNSKKHITRIFRLLVTRRALKLRILHSDECLQSLLYDVPDSYSGKGFIHLLLYSAGLFNRETAATDQVLKKFEQ
jgi:hypothetical protein